MRERVVVAARNYVLFREWCRTHDINLGAVKYVSDRNDLYGLGEYHLVLLDGYNRHPLFRDNTHTGLQLVKFATKTYYQWDVPLVQQGRITGWE